MREAVTSRGYRVLVTTMHERPRTATIPQAGLSSTLANGALCAAAFSSSWTAAALGAYNLVDYILAGATLLTALAWIANRRRMYIDAWMVMPTVAVLIVSAAHVMIGDATTSSPEKLLRVALSTAVVAVLLTSVATNGQPRPLLRILKWWAAGIAVNGIASIAVELGVVSFEGVLVQPTGERLSGLSSHPNSIAFSIVLALPVMFYLFEVGRAWGKLFWAAAIAASLWGLYLADSRAGWLVGIPTIAVALALLVRRSRARLLFVPILIVGAIAAALYVPSLFDGTRLVEGSAESDSGRTGINQTALDLFAANPLLGGGLEQQIGVAVPLMVLSGGGAVLAIGYYWFVLRPLPVLWRSRSSAIAQTGILSLGVFLAFGLLNPVFVERATFWPILIPALVVTLTHYVGGNPWRQASSIGVVGGRSSI